MTVAELSRRMTATEFDMWRAYYQVEPFGEERGDLRIAILTATTRNQHRGKGEPAFKPVDFMPFTEKPAQDPAAIAAAIRKAFGAPPEPTGGD